MQANEVRIVADSSAEPLPLCEIATASAPVKITTAETTYVDDEFLDVPAMTRALAAYKGKSATACPSMNDFLTAFGDGKYIFCLTVTAKLSGTYNVALSAAREYEAMHPERRVCVIDSRCTGPGMRLLAEKIAALTAEGLEFDEVAAEVNAYRDETELLFLLSSMYHLANNGRCSRAMAKLAGLLGVRALGHAVRGEIRMAAKPRGAARALHATYEKMLDLGYCGGKVRISHCENESAAQDLAARIRAAYPEADIGIYPARGLCSYYAERGGLILGFEVHDPLLGF